MRTLFSWILIAAGILAVAQDRLLTIEEAIIGYHLYPKNLNGLQWLPGGGYAHIDPSGTAYIVQKDAEVQMVDLSMLNKALSEAGLDSVQWLPSIQWLDQDRMAFKNGDSYIHFNRKTQVAKKAFDLHEGSSEIQYTEDGKGYVAVIKDGFAYNIQGMYGHVTTRTKGVVIGQAVHRFEFGINKGLFLSPKGKRLAYYYKDESMVSEYPLYNLSGTPASADMIRYPTAGKPSHHVKLRVKTIGGADPDIELKLSGPAEQYLTNISWTPDGEHILIAIVNRDQDHMWLNQYNALSGEYEKTLFEEEQRPYVEPEHPAYFLPTDPSKFVWWSERDGYNHLYLYNADGTLVRQLTKGEWVVTAFHGFSADGEQLFVTTTGESPIERHLYCIDVASGKHKNLSKAAAYHSFTANEDCSLFFDSYSSESIPRVVNIINAKGKEVQKLHKAEDPFTDYKASRMDLGKMKNDQGDDLYYRIFYPSDFDPSIKYPAVVYLYNGPHAQLVTNSWLGGANYWYPYMAQHGYVVFTIDGRGSANRGYAFESAIHGNVGQHEMEDQLTGLRWLKSQAFVDSSRVGIHGWSYGGFMTINMMTRTPGNYKVGVAGGPVIDWELYEVMYTERYMDRPDENPEGFESTDLKNYVTDLQGDLLVIHGGQDDVVLWEHSLEYLESAIKKGVQIDYFVYPHHKHNVIGRDRVHLYDKVSRYFFDKL